MHLEASFENWTQERFVRTLGTNSGSLHIPFQNWRHFKEAFAPELINRAINENPIPTLTCLDPFGGSGTTALACQFLGVHPTTIEVNPYLADLIESKLASYSADDLAFDFGVITRLFNKASELEYSFPLFPRTLVEPGEKGRWLFSKEIAQDIFKLKAAIDKLSCPRHRRLFRVLLGGILVDLSNVVISGKGRRYRRNWESRETPADLVFHNFTLKVNEAISDIHLYSNRSCKTYDILRGDSRQMSDEVNDLSLCVFSPPYPNSFDYTDVYNVELWVLGYLQDSSSNRTLRQSTLGSHVQVARTFASPPQGSDRLDCILDRLNANLEELWDRNIPAMVGGYFSDLMTVLDKVNKKLQPGGTTWMVVGDSIYSGVHIETAKILQDLLVQRNWKLLHIEPFRSMQCSPQQGGRSELAETLIVVQPD